MDRRQRVVLFGASGTMGWWTFRELWRRRREYDLTLLLRPSFRNRRRFAPYLRVARQEKGTDLTVVWGDAVRYEDVRRAVAGADHVLHAMACISPRADYHPDEARAVNVEAVRHILRAIEEEPGGPERIRLVYTGSVAETGDRLPPIHWGRVGDPLKPAVYDLYAVTKTEGERLVLESRIRRWASLRLTFILPTLYRDYVSLPDPIMFHMPLDTCMENLTDRDAGYGLARCLDLPDDSPFWRGIYNMGGGPAMRIGSREFQDRALKLFGVSGLAAVTERRWFATTNFHLQYYLDSDIPQSFLGYQRDDLRDWERALLYSMPPGLALLLGLIRRVPVLQRLMDRTVRRRFREMAEEHPNGTAYWRRHGNDRRIRAFFRSIAAYDALGGWDGDVPAVAGGGEPVRLDHGYDESKTAWEDEELAGAAAFRGGSLVDGPAGGDPHEPARWRCAEGHLFSLKPNTVLRGGHWCPECLAPPWRYPREALRNPFFAQVWTPLHGEDETGEWDETGIRDIVGADEPARRSR